MNNMEKYYLSSMRIIWRDVNQHVLYLGLSPFNEE